MNDHESGSYSSHVSTAVMMSPSVFGAVSIKTEGFLGPQAVGKIPELLTDSCLKDNERSQLQDLYSLFVGQAL